MAGDYRLITEYWLAANFTPKSEITAGSNNTLIMDCTQIGSRYSVTISGGTPTSTRCSSQNELANYGLPTVTTNTQFSVSSGVINSGGNVTSIGGASVTDKGLCWSTSINPTLSDYASSGGSGIGVFTVNMSGSSLTTYHYRAYATNSFGTTYGSDQTFYFVNIGDSYLTGIVAYLSGSGDAGYDQYNQHGIVMASSDYGTRAGWGSNSLVSGTSAGYGTGLGNTALIVTHYGSFTTAAKICQDAGWILPSYNDLYNMWTKCLQNGGFSDDVYWSSTEYGTNDAYKRNMSTYNTVATMSPGDGFYLPKGGTGLVRMIKYF